MHSGEGPMNICKPIVLVLCLSLALGLLGSCSSDPEVISLDSSLTGTYEITSWVRNEAGCDKSVATPIDRPHKLNHVHWEGDYSGPDQTLIIPVLQDNEHSYLVMRECRPSVRIGLDADEKKRRIKTGDWMPVWLTFVTTPASNSTISDEDGYTHELVEDNCGQDYTWINAPYFSHIGFTHDYMFGSGNDADGWTAIDNHTWTTYGWNNDTPVPCQGYVVLLSMVRLDGGTVRIEKRTYDVSTFEPTFVEASDGDIWNVCSVDDANASINESSCRELEVIEAAPSE